MNQQGCHRHGHWILRQQLHALLLRSLGSLLQDTPECKIFSDVIIAAAGSGLCHFVPVGGPFQQLYLQIVIQDSASVSNGYVWRGPLWLLATCPELCKLVDLAGEI
jgi:hypothetical protein